MMRYVSKAVLFTALFQSALAALVEVSACDGAPLPYQVEISNCTAQPCPLIRGADTVLIIDFFAPYYIETFSPQAKATAADVTLNYPLTSQKNGCNFIENTRCPLEEEEYISYKLTMTVLKIFPKVSVGIAFSLLDQDQNVINCFFVNTEVVDEI